MKTCSQLKDLEQFGIKLLTGEADALGYRILCDLDAQGVRVFKECFGLPRDTSENDPTSMRNRVYGMAANWNSGSIASVMLTGYELVPLAIMGFYLQGYDVVATDHTVFALEKNERIELDSTGEHYLVGEGELWTWPESYGTIRRIIRQRKSDGQRVQGTRNVHQMSGRVS
jgi:hypothetical protein